LCIVHCALHASVWNPLLLPLPLQRFGVPLELRGKPIESPARAGRELVALFVERRPDPRHRERARDARHAELAEQRLEVNGGPYAGELPARIRHDGRGPEEVLLEEVIQQIGEGRRKAVVVLARHDDECVGRAIERRQRFERLRRFTLRVLLVHAVEQRQLHLERVDKRHVVSPCPKTALDEPGGANALPVAAHRPVEEDDFQGHALLLGSEAPHLLGCWVTAAGSRSMVRL